MRRLWLFGAALVSLGMATVSAPARGALTVSEPFSYPDGALAAQNGGTGFNTAWGNANGDTAGGTHTVTNGTVNDVSGNIFRGLTSSFPASGTLWMSLDFQRSSGSYDGISLFTGTSEKFLVGAVNSDATWDLGKNGSSSGGSSSTVSNATLKTGILRFTLDSGSNGSASLWVGSGQGTVDVSGAPAATLTGLTLTGINTVRLGTSGSQIIDNLQFGDTAADVGGVPEPGAIGIIALAGLAFLRRRAKRDRMH